MAKKDILDLVRKRECLNLRMTKVDKTDLQFLADQRGLSMGSMVTTLIAEEMKRKGYERSESMYLEAVLKNHLDELKKAK